MNHLTCEELIDFVSLTELSEDAAKLMGRVNTHIIQCEECHKKLMMFQAVYDELSAIRDREAVRTHMMSLEHEGR